jgi:hypothetical protein
MCSTNWPTPTAFMAGVQRLYGSDAQATDTLRFKDGRVFERYTRAWPGRRTGPHLVLPRRFAPGAHARGAGRTRRAVPGHRQPGGDGIDLVDAETLCFLEVNEAACRMLGYRREELVGQPWP